MSSASTAAKAAAPVPHARAARAPATSSSTTAATGGGADAASVQQKKRPASSYVFLRIKRKRHDDPVETLVVQSEPELKKQSTRKGATGISEEGEEEKGDNAKTPAAAASPADLLKAFTNLSTKEKSVAHISFVFKRIDTMEKHHLEDVSSTKWTQRLKQKVKSMKEEPRPALKKSGVIVGQQSLAAQNRLHQQQDRLKERRKSDAQRSRGLSGAAAAPSPQPSIEIKQQQTLELPGIRLVDLETVVRAPSSSEPTSFAADGALSDGVTMNGAKMRPTRVLNPSEREVDEAIWHAFRENDFSRFFKIFHSQAPESRLNPVTFQRPADGSTILMAAAMHGRVDVIEVVLRSSSASALVQDWEGATAASFAARSGFKNVEVALRACEDAEREKDYVYDVYCVDVTASTEHDNSAPPTPDGDDAKDAVASAPIVSVSAAVQKWLSQDANWQADESENVEEYMLESDAESNVDEDGESVDSNDENHAFNDYPDEESDASDYDSDDSEQELTVSHVLSLSQHQKRVQSPLAGVSHRHHDEAALKAISLLKTRYLTTVDHHANMTATTPTKVPKFLQSLYAILHDEDQSILTWSVDGVYFQVLDVARLEREVLPNFRKWTKTRSNVCTFSHDVLVRCEYPSGLSALSAKYLASKNTCSFDNLNMTQLCALEWVDALVIDDAIETFASADLDCDANVSLGPLDWEVAASDCLALVDNGAAATTTVYDTELCDFILDL
ncbi:Transcription factor iwr1, partial [Globisporangium splendens]